MIKYVILWGFLCFVCSYSMENRVELKTNWLTEKYTLFKNGEKALQIKRYIGELGPEDLFCYKAEDGFWREDNKSKEQFYKLKELYERQQKKQDES